MFRWCIIFLIPWTQISLAEEFNDPQLSYFGIQCSDGYEKVSQVINLEEQIEIDAPLFLHEKASISFCRSEMNQLKQGPFLISDKNGMKATGEFENDIVKGQMHIYWPNGSLAQRISYESKGRIYRTTFWNAMNTRLLAEYQYREGKLYQTFFHNFYGRKLNESLLQNLYVRAVKNSKDIHCASNKPACRKVRSKFKSSLLGSLKSKKGRFSNFGSR